MSKLHLLYISLTITLTTALASCGLIPNLGCDIKMTKEYIESTCGLYNGVRFEQLQVDSFYSDNTPKIFRVVTAFKGRLGESKTKNRDRIYFNDSSGKYIWWTDTTTHWIYHKWGTHKERIDIRDTVPPETSNEVEVVITKDSVVRLGSKPRVDLENYNSEPYFVCPIKFKPDTWYYLNFYDQRYEAYLYVDKNMNYKIEQINLPTNI